MRGGLVLFVVGLLLVVATAGCSNSKEDAGDQAGADVDPSQANKTVSAPGANALVAPSEDGRTLDVFYVNGTFDVAVADLVLHSISGGYPDHEFMVWDNATSITVELSWSSAVPQLDVDVFLYSPVWFAMDQAARAQVLADELQGRPTEGRFRESDGTPGSGASPSVVELDRPTLDENACPTQPCTWQVWLLAEPAHVDLEYSYRIQVNYA